MSESRQPMLCAYLSAALLIGLLATAVAVGGGRIPSCALAIGAVALREARDAWRGESCGCCSPPSRPRRPTGYDAHAAPAQTSLAAVLEDNDGVARVTRSGEDRASMLGVLPERAEMAITVVACGHCRAQFATTVPRDFIERVRRCGECGQRALIIKDAGNGATVRPGSGVKATTKRR